MHLVPFVDGSVSVTGERIVATSVLLPQPAISFFREVAPQVGGGAVHWVRSSGALCWHERLGVVGDGTQVSCARAEALSPTCLFMTKVS